MLDGRQTEKLSATDWRRVVNQVECWPVLVTVGLEVSVALALTVI